MAQLEFAIDLGSSFFTVYQKGVGLVLREPNMALLQGDGNVVKEIGYKAKNMHTSMLGNSKPVYPVKEGIIVDSNTAVLVFKEFFKKILPEGIIKRKFTALVLVTGAMKVAERKTVEKVFTKVGANAVYVCDSPLALYEYTGTKGGMFVDIGGGKTEVASVGDNGIVAGATVNIAGNAFTNAIIDLIAEKYYIKIGEITAEKLKCESLSFYRNDAGVDFVSGASMSDGMPKNAEIMAQDLFDAVAPLVDDLVDVMMSVLASTPPELASEIYRKGFFISGGSSQIAGLNQYLADRMGLYSTMLNDPENGVAIGGGKFLDCMDDLGSLIGVDLNN